MSRIAPVLLYGLFLLAACSNEQLSVEEFQHMAREVEEQSTSIAARQGDMRALLQSYNQTVPPAHRMQLSIDPEAGIPDEERTLLKARIDEESDASCRGLLEQLLVIQEEIDESHARLHELTDRLPAPHRVRSGENHYTLCMDYLSQQQGLPQAQADSLVARVALNSDILEGFHVWFYFHDGVFGTFVTQGDAHVSPTVFAKVVKRHLLEEARRQGRQEAFETILDSLKRSGALIANIRHGAAGQ
ncbi:MAG: hypothetical protein KFF77_03810 [Bacteroidetes bacterium]|nr:hypothetical protein [Bacteroidota bacterium]